MPEGPRAAQRMSLRLTGVRAGAHPHAAVRKAPPRPSRRLACWPTLALSEQRSARRSGSRQLLDVSRPRDRLDVARADRLPAGRADQASVAEPAAPPVDQAHRWAVWCSVLVAPLAHGGDHGPQVASLLRQPVVEARWVLAVGDLGQHTELDQPSQALVEDTSRDSESLLELVKAGHPKEGVANDQRRPPLADDLQALRNRAVHAREALAFHAFMVVGCVIELNAVPCAFGHRTH